MMKLMDIALKYLENSVDPYKSAPSLFAIPSEFFNTFPIKVLKNWSPGLWV